MAKRSKKLSPAGGGISAQVPGAADFIRKLSSWLSQEVFWGLILVLAVILAYQPVWHAGFIWDDDAVATANPVIVGPLGLKEIWTTHFADICPLTLTLFWVEHALWGPAPMPYHLVNVLLHTAGAVLLWRVLGSLEVPGAWLGAVLWALHPVEVESVAWISEMKNTLSAVFYLLSILFFVKELTAQESVGRKAGGWNYALTLLFAAMAMASKSSTVILPVVLGLCTWWVEGRWHWRSLIKTGPIFLMSAAASAASIWTQKAGENAGEMYVVRSWLERLLTAGDAVWFYVGKLVWPHPLLTVYPQWKIDEEEWLSYVPLLAVIAVLVILWLKRETWGRGCFFTFAYFLVALFPVLGWANMNFFRYSYVADHFQYLAAMGPLALAGAGMIQLSDRILPARPWLQRAMGVGLLLILGLVSWQRNGVYQSEGTLWTDELSKNPYCWVGYCNLGNVLARKADLDAAIEQYQKALKINPLDPAIHNDLAAAFFRRGRLDEAIEEYQKALNRTSVYGYMHDNLGVALLKKGRVDEAIVQFQAALKIDPHSASAHYSLGNALVQKGRVDEAMIQYQRAFEADASYAAAHNNLGVSLFGKGQVDAAIVQYQKALETSPRYADAHSNLGEALLKKGQVNAAIEQFQDVVRLKPDDDHARNNLEQAEAMARQAAGLNSPGL